MLTVRAVSNLDEWNEAVSRLPSASPHILQSFEWGEFKAKYGWTCSRVLFIDKDEPRAAAQILRRAVPHTPFGVLYVPKGPVLDFENAKSLRETLNAVEQIGREQRAIFIKIDPDIPLSQVETIRTIQDCGWKPSPEQIQFRNTLVLDLTACEEDLLARMKPKTRYNVRLAQKRNVVIRPGNRNDLPRFYQMYAETSARDGFLIRQFQYYRDAWGAFMDAGRAQMFLACVGEKAIAGLILFLFGRTAWYFYGASSGEHRELMPNYLLQWHAIRWAKEQGCQNYDFWGAPEILNEADPMHGVYRFKEGFGARFVQNIGAFDFIIHPVLYYFYSVVRPRYLSRLRSRHRLRLEES